MNHYLEEFCRTTEELLGSDAVRMMGRWKHHGHISTLDHSLFVAYCSYRAAAPCGWMRPPRPGPVCCTTCTSTTLGTRRRTPAGSALTIPARPPETRRSSPRSLRRSATSSCPICGPWAGQLPRSWEAWLVDLVDTLCAGLELAHIYHPGRLRERLGVQPLLEEELAAAPC